MSHIINARNLSFTYAGGIRALSELTFSVKEGEVLAVMGANGAGKTTLCFLLSAVIPNIYGGTRDGELMVAGVDPWYHTISEMSQKLAIVLQDPDTQLLMPTLKMELAFGPENLGKPPDEILKKIPKVLKLVGLEGAEERSPRDLSGGQKQRAVLAATLMMEPSVLVLDEPTSQLDPIGTMEVVEILQALKGMEKTAIVMTTHDAEIVARLADQLLILEKGRQVFYGSAPEGLKQVDLLERVGVRPPAAMTYLHRLRQYDELAPAIPDRFLSTSEAAEVLHRLISEGQIHTASQLNLPVQTKPSHGGAVLEARNLTFVYPSHPPVVALRDVSLTIYEGEFVGIIGQNGSGKTTLVKHFVGLLRPTKGSVLFRGEDLTKYSVGQISRKIGFVLQNPDYQLFTISSSDEIRFGLQNLGVPSDQIEDIVDKALTFVGLKDEKETFPFRLSFGDRRKLAVAVVLAMNPEVIIMDEPTTAQDYRGRYMLADIARELNRQGKTVVMITHDMNLVAEYADRIIVMQDGRIILQGPPRVVFKERHVLKQASLSPPEITQLSATLYERGLLPDIALTVNEMLRMFKPGGAS